MLCLARFYNCYDIHPTQKSLALRTTLVPRFFSVRLRVMLYFSGLMCSTTLCEDGQMFQPFSISALEAYPSAFLAAGKAPAAENSGEDLHDLRLRPGLIGRPWSRTRAGQPGFFGTYNCEGSSHEGEVIEFLILAFLGPSIIFIGIHGGVWIAKE